MPNITKDPDENGDVKGVWRQPKFKVVILQAKRSLPTTKVVGNTNSGEASPVLSRSYYFVVIDHFSPLMRKVAAIDPVAVNELCRH